MAHDEKLAERTRRAIGLPHNVTGKKMDLVRAQPRRARGPTRTMRGGDQKVAVFQSPWESLLVPSLIEEVQLEKSRFELHPFTFFEQGHIRRYLLEAAV